MRRIILRDVFARAARLRHSTAVFLVLFFFLDRQWSFFDAYLMMKFCFVNGQQSRGYCKFDARRESESSSIFVFELFAKRNWPRSLIVDALSESSGVLVLASGCARDPRPIKKEPSVVRHCSISFISSNASPRSPYCRFSKRVTKFTELWPHNAVEVSLGADRVVSDDAERLDSDSSRHVRRWGRQRTELLPLRPGSSASGEPGTDRDYL